MAAPAAPMTAQQAQQKAMQDDRTATQLIVGRSVKMTQNIYSNTINPTTQTTINVPMRMVGLLLGFWVDIQIATADPTSTNVYSLTALGPANVVKQFVLTDLNNINRIQTTGWHIHFVNTAKKGAPFGVVRTNTSYPIAYGNNWTTAFAAGATVTNGSQPTIYMRYWVPAAYSDFDLRGSMYLNVVNATAYLQINLTPGNEAFIATGSDPVSAVYIATTGSPTSNWGTTCTINVYQVYYDQLPKGQNGAPILPLVSLSTNYELKNTTMTGLSSGQDFPIPYSNFRDFLSTFVIYDNGGTLDTGQFTTSWALQTANLTNIFKQSANLTAFQARLEIQDDYPTGVYYFPTRNKPISTTNYGNMELVLTPTGTISASAKLLIGFEDFSMTNTVVGAASLSTGS